MSKTKKARIVTSKKSSTKIAKDIIVQANKIKAFFGVCATEAVGPLIIILALNLIQYTQLTQFIIEIANAIDITITAAQIITVINSVSIILAILAAIFVIFNYISIIRPKIAYNPVFIAWGKEKIPYMEIIRVNFKNDRFYHKILRTSGLYISFTGRSLLPLYMEYVDNADIHAQRILDFVEADKAKRYRK